MNVRRVTAVLAAAVSIVLMTLALPAPAQATSFPRAFISILRGANEVPAADPDAFAIALATINPTSGKVCYFLAEKKIDGDVTLAHIHRGARGANGPVVVPLDAPTDGVSHNCTTIDTALADEIVGNPRGFYFNIHSTAFPAGAVRAQLR